ncbi:bifunctional folylpolyglutamate synthase/dihydrofolate synthase [Peptoniphilus obesi]|uniref:bifunctional folylpolyglutamate synthase/dihydrofolate synthase n=1 Tax=Peptoniphilus obesi TaxID=1472765 RepID=UPI0004B06192|nr:folylpolyglutamate synthase/dihydrofolate synthase family protein [Peptoniphilus obesi]
MKKEDILNNINSREVKRRSYDLSRMLKLLEELGNPQCGMKFVHVAGTNGKGSTSKLVYNMLRQTNLNVGLTISPHILEINERIVVNDSEINDQDFVTLSEKVLKAENIIEAEYEKLTYFEFITAVAFLYFKEKKCDICVLEVGMGGLSDSTNVIRDIDKVLCLITPISFDHMAFLGNTIEEIASQKAGIITKNTSVITYNEDDKVLKIIEDEARKKESNFYSYKEIKVDNLRIDEFSSSFDLSFKNHKIEDIKLNLLGYYQVHNAMLAIAGVLELVDKNIIDISYDEIKKAVANTRWQGRMELINKNPRIVLDGAHNSDGIDNLVRNFSLFKYNKLYIISSILSDKDHKKMLESLSKYSKDLFLLDLDNIRKTEIDILKREAEEYFENVEITRDIKSAIEDVKKLATNDDLIVITGSLYLVSEIKQLFA